MKGKAAAQGSLSKTTRVESAGLDDSDDEERNTGNFMNHS